MTAREQLEKWGHGESIHNDELKLCCPDFSCCHPELAWPDEKRQEFIKAFLERNVPRYTEMLLEALSSLLGTEISGVLIMTVGEGQAVRKDGEALN